MLPFKCFILLICYCFLACNALQCITNCSYTLSFGIPFDVPVQCSQVASAGKCHVVVTFWYYLQEYVVTLNAGSSNTISSSDNQRHAMFEVRPTDSYYFKYDIHHACKDRNDCAQDFARAAITEMIQRKIDYQSIISELRPLVSADSQSENTTNLVCFDSEETTSQCAVATNLGSCVIADKLIEKEITYYCNTGMHARLGYLNISDSGSFATFDIHCNQSLCNELSTLKAAKSILFKYGLTETPEGRLNNSSQLIKISVWLIISLLAIKN
ncbi:unnamed protein product [Rotaria socialis]|uniref:Uncharacterized protein n=1 Tax=Rotaria socialis TaxID=392032 RepID=A0A818PZD4_9BILA|nr:unnamed protein product [Rotaria socialis]CAF4378078.1 unnamed protein product [Rotaria socialis]